MTRKGEVNYDIDLKEGLAMYEEATDKAQDRAASLGLQVEREPPTYQEEEYDGRLPPNYADFDLHDLSELLSVATEWSDYVEGIFLQAKAEKKNRENQLKLARAKVRKTKSGNAADKDDDTVTDDRFVRASVLLEESEEFLAIVEANYLAAKRDREAVSRVATMRGQQMEHGARVDNLKRGNVEKSPRLSVSSRKRRRKR